MEDRTVIEWDKDDLDALKIYKIDVLALGMLTALRKSFALIKQHYGKAEGLGMSTDDRPSTRCCAKPIRSASSRSRAAPKCRCCRGRSRANITTWWSRSPSCAAARSRAAWSTLAAQGLDAIDCGLGCRLMQVIWTRAAILQAGQAFGFEAIDSFTHRARANAYGFTGGLRRLPTENHVDHVLSTERCQAGILMDVHSAPPRIVDVSTTSASSAGPGWTIESSLLAALERVVAGPNPYRVHSFRELRAVMRRVYVT